MCPDTTQAIPASAEVPTPSAPPRGGNVPGAADWLDVALEEYRALRANAWRAFARQRMVFAGGLVVFAIVVGLGLVAKHGTAAATAALVVFAPLVVLVLASLWSDAQAELLRTESSLQRLERSINARFPLDPPPLRWQSRADDPETAHGLLVSYRIAVVALLLVSVASATYGIVQRHPAPVGAVLLALAVVLVLVPTLFLVWWQWLVKTFKTFDVPDAIDISARPLNASKAAGTLAARERFLLDERTYTARELFPDAPEDAEERAYQILFDRRAFALERAGEILFPQFQFDAELRPRPVVAQVLAVLGEDDPLGRWELALWFTTPSAYLEGRRPVALLDREPARVVAAARDEFEPVVS